MPTLYDGCVVIRGRLTPEQGALVMKALAGAGDALHESEDDSREACAAPDAAIDAHAARRADALALLAETFLAQGAAPLAAAERHQVILHVAESVLREPSGGAGVSREHVVDAHAPRERVGGGRGSREQVDDERAPDRLAAEELCEIADVAALPAATARRVCCDASVVRVVENQAGDVLDVCRKTRVVAAVMRRALAIRDRGCRFPGCTNLRLIGRDPDPTRSRDHAALSVLAERRLRSGSAADVAAPLEDARTPPIESLGAMHIDEFRRSRPIRPRSVRSWHS